MLVMIMVGVAAMMTVLGGVMEYFTLLNICSMYITQKKPELTVMRINGFTVGEVKRYLLTETLITTVLGIILGIAAGVFLSYTVVVNAETGYTQYIRTPNLFAWVISAVLTILFTVGINAIAMRKIKHLKLTDMTA